MQKEIAWLLKEKYRGRTGAGYQADVQRLKRGEPLAYVIGFVDFLGSRIDLSYRPLIPRPETEHWVAEAIDAMRLQRPLSVEPARVLDLFSGSGCIGISIVRHMPEAFVVFADKDPLCIKQIGVNCRRNKIPKRRYRIVASDVFKGISGRYDYIFANPPYIPMTKKNRVAISVSAHEPAGALFGGNDGMRHIRKFLSQALVFLADGGRVYMEFGVGQKRAIATLAKALGYREAVFHQDQYRRWRWVALAR